MGERREFINFGTALEKRFRYTANFISLDFWADEKELHHHVFVAPTEYPDQFTYVTPTGLSACVWDLRPQAVERDVWVIHVLQRSPGGQRQLLSAWTR